MLLRLALPCSFVLGLALAACLGVGCGSPSSSGEGDITPAAAGDDTTGAPQNASGDTGEQGDAIPPAVKMARADEPGTDLLPGTEKTLETAEGVVTVKKADDGTVVDEYDGRAYPR